MAPAPVTDALPADLDDAPEDLPAVLPPSATPTPLTRRALAREQAALRTLETDLGGRDALVRMLLCAPRDPFLEPALQRLADPAEDTTPLADILVAADIWPSRLLDLCATGLRARLELLSFIRTVDKAPAVLDTIARQSVPYEKPCETCHGTGTLKDGKTVCPGCMGQATFLVQPRLATQKMYLTLARLLKGGPTTLIDQRVLTVKQSGSPDTLSGRLGTGAGAGASLVPNGSYLERQQQATDRVLYEDRRPVALPGRTTVMEAEVREETVVRAVRPDVAVGPVRAERAVRAVNLAQFADDDDGDGDGDDPEDPPDRPDPDDRPDPPDTDD